MKSTAIRLMGVLLLGAMTTCGYAAQAGGAKAPEAKKKEAAAAEAKKKAAEALAQAEDRAVENYKHNKGGSMTESKAAGKK